MAPFERPARTAVFAGSVLALIAVDRPLTAAWQRNVVTSIDYRIPSFAGPRNPFWFDGASTWLPVAVPAHYLASLALRDERGQTAALLAAKAATYSYLVSHLLLKSVAGRQRPSPNLDSAATPGKTRSPWKWGYYDAARFDSEGEGTSFPSFHATFYSAIATVYGDVYGNHWIPVAAAVAMFGSELGSHNHWIADLVAGSAIGAMIGRTVTRDLRRRSPADTTESSGWTFALSPDPASGVRVALSRAW